MIEYIKKIIPILLVMIFMYSVISLFLIDDVDDRTFFGFKPIYLNNDSLYPLVYKGDIILSKKCKVNHVDIDDVVLFEHNDKLMTHIVYDNKDLLKTKNMKDDIKDAFVVTNGSLKGKIVYHFKLISFISRSITNIFDNN